METPSRDLLLTGCRLLLVEDNRDVAEMTAIALEAFGADVRCAFSGSEALAEAGREAVDVAVLDLGLPDIRGPELARELRARRAAARIIALTGFDEPASVADSFDAFLQKPISAGALARAIAEAAGRPPQPGAGT